MKSNKVDFGRGRGGGQVVSVLAFLSNNPSLIPAEVQNFSVKIVVEKNENKQKEAGDGPIFLKKISNAVFNCEAKLGVSPRFENSLMVNPRHRFECTFNWSYLWASKPNS